MAHQLCHNLPQLKLVGGDKEFQQFASRDATVRSSALRLIRERTARHRPPFPERFLLFSNILPRDCETIVSAAHELRFHRGQTIHIEGDPVRRVVLLTSGAVKIIQHGENGTEVILRLCGQGELVGTLGVPKKGVHCSTSHALRMSDALVWDRTVFESLSGRFPILRLNAALILGKQLNDLEERFREVATERVAMRLSRQVIRLTNQVGMPVDGGFEINISREELAQLIGTTMFTVSRLLSEWDRQGILETRREAVVIHDLNALEEVSQRVD
jgi:CRP-like cAMP-binding protein